MIMGSSNHRREESNDKSPWTQGYQHETALAVGLWPDGDSGHVVKDRGMMHPVKTTSGELRVDTRTVRRCLL